MLYQSVQVSFCVLKVIFSTFKMCVCIVIFKDRKTLWVNKNNPQIEDSYLFFSF